MRTKILVVSLLSAFAFASCNDEGLLKNQEDALDKSASIAVNEIMMESTVDEGQYEAGFYAETERLLKQTARLKGRQNKLMNWNVNMRYKMGECPNVSIDKTEETQYPVTITLDYGEGTELKNGRTLSGVIVIVISAPRETDGASRTVTFQGYSVDSVTVNGTINETFTGDGTTSRVRTNSSNLTFTLADGTTVERKETRTNEWLTGLDTPLDHSDDTVQITGKVEASNSAGQSYTKEITKPLIKTGECRHPVSGEVTVIQNGTVLFVLDYGDGTCDNKAILTAQDETIEIDLKEKQPRPVRNTKKRK